MLSEVARRLGSIYAAQSGGLNKRDVTIAIAEAFVADFGASPVKAKKTANKKPAKKTTRKTAKKSAKKKR